MSENASSNLVRHPQISCWMGNRSWTAEGEPLSEFVVYDTDNENLPFRIQHNRDQIRDGDELTQDYNFIDYFFGDPSDPTHARHYLLDDHVSVDLPTASKVIALQDARKAFPPDILCYLQKRFPKIKVLVAEGYKELWSIPE